jgi:hypothetical protein
MEQLKTCKVLNKVGQFMRWGIASDMHWENCKLYCSLFLISNLGSRNSQGLAVTQGSRRKLWIYAEVFLQKHLGLHSGYPFWISMMFIISERLAVSNWIEMRSPRAVWHLYRWRTVLLRNSFTIHDLLCCFLSFLYFKIKENSRFNSCMNWCPLSVIYNKWWKVRIWFTVCTDVKSLKTFMKQKFRI